MIKTHQAVMVGVVAALGWLAAQRVRDEVPGALGIAIGALAGMVVQTTAIGWLERNI